MTIPIRSRRKKPPVEFHLGSTSLGRADGDFEATLIVTPGAEPRVRLTQLAWGAGVGWYAQHTLELGVEEAHQIAALLSRAPRSGPAEQDRVMDPVPAPVSARAPIDLAAVRARRAASRTASAPGPAAGRIPTPIVRCDRAALLDDGATEA